MSGLGDWVLYIYIKHKNCVSRETWKLKWKDTGDLGSKRKSAVLFCWWILEECLCKAQSVDQVPGQVSPQSFSPLPAQTLISSKSPKVTKTRINARAPAVNQYLK